MNKKRLAEHLEKLATFRHVADLKSVHRASSRLGLSQPAVSRTIKVLEDVLECQLMERKSRGISLTEAGKSLYEYAKLIEKTLENFDPSAGGAFSERPFKIATYDNIACSILSDLGPALTTELPQLSISVGGPNSRILGDLLAGKFDCALMAQPKILPGIEYKKVFDERYGFFVGKNLFKKATVLRKKILSSEDLREIKLVAMPDAIAGANRNVDRLLWEMGLQSVLSIDSYEVAIRLVLDGHGIGIMPFSSAWREIRDGNLMELLLRGVPRETFGRHDLTLCWSSEGDVSKVEVFRKLILQVYSQI